MNIQITGLPDNQKIKSINFNIVFDDSNVESTSMIVDSKGAKYSIESKQTGVDKEEIIKPEEVDISKREPKIDPNMIEESF